MTDSGSTCSLKRALDTKFPRNLRDLSPGSALRALFFVEWGYNSGNGLAFGGWRGFGRGTRIGDDCPIVDGVWSKAESRTRRRLADSRVIGRRDKRAVDASAAGKLGDAESGDDAAAVLRPHLRIGR